MRTNPRRARTLVASGALVVLLAACGGGGGDDASGGEAQTSVTVVGTDDLKYQPEQLSVAAGEEITVTLECGDAVEHDFIIEGLDDDREIAFCDPGGTATGTFTVEAGSYTYYCSIPGHRQAGMEGTLTAS
jgi:plastocyanin